MLTIILFWNYFSCNRKYIFSTLILFFLIPAFIYSQGITGNIEGLIADSTGEPLTGVNISLISTALLGTRGTATNDNGYFQIISLPVGKYSLKISAVGFSQMNVEDVEVRLGKTSGLGVIVLKQETLSLPEISVSGKKPLIDPVSTSYGGNISSADFEQLPLDRNFESIATLLPQSNVSYYNYDGPNIGGATGFENKFYIDGVEVTDPVLGTSNVLTSVPKLPYNFIREVEVKTGGYSVGSRSSLGGLINVVTYSGSNEFHGSVFGFYTNNQLYSNRKLGLRDVFGGTFSDYDFGFSLGGPVILDKLWFYAAYNPRFNRRNVEVPGFGTCVDKMVTHSFAVKLNWRATDNLDIIFTSTGNPIEEYAVGREAGIVSVLANPDVYLENLVTGSVNYSLNGTYTIGKNFSLNGLIAKVDRYFYVEGATERGRNEIQFHDNVSDFWSGGSRYFRHDFRYSVTGKISGSLILRDHVLSSGFEYKTSTYNINYHSQLLERNAEDDFIETHDMGLGDVANRLPSVFIMDSWRMTDWLKLTAGIRWDGHYIVGSNGKIVQTISVPLQPRVGFIILPDRDNAQRIFGSFGRYSQEFPLFQSAIYHTENGYHSETKFGHDPRIDSNGGDVKIYPHVIRSEVKDLLAPYYDEFSLGYERAIGWNTKVGVQGVYRTLRQTIEVVWLQDIQNFQYGNPGRGILSDWPKPVRDYTAAIITIEHSGNEHFNFLASYVISRNYGNYEGFFSSFFPTQVPNAGVTFNDLTSSRINTTGLLPNDRTHIFKFSGYYSFSSGLITGISFIAQSGTPLSEFFGTGPVNRGIQFLSPRGSVGRTPTIWDLSARIIYKMNIISDWHTKLILDVSHIASQSEVVDIDQQKYLSVDENGNPSNPNHTYGEAFRYQPSMSMRLGMEVSF